MSTLAAFESEEYGDLLSRRTLEFIRYARDNRYAVGVSEQLLVQQALLHIDPFDLKSLRWSLRSLICSDKRGWQRFDELFDGFWLHDRKRTAHQALSASGSSLQLAQSNEQQNSSKASTSSAGDNQQSGDSEGGEGSGYQEGASRSTSIEQVDFGSITDPEEMRRVEIIAERMARSMKKRLSRRSKVHRTRGQIELRRTARRSLSTGGEALHLIRKQRKRRAPRLLLILDVSRSMSMYSFTLLRFARGLALLFKDSAVFAFHTQLLPITDALRQTSLARVKNSLSLFSQGWSGGTKIGDSLEQLNSRYGSWINKRTLTCVVSDGFDTGDTQVLERAVHNLKQRSRSVLWLNPLWGQPGYQPESQGMKVVLPLVDEVAPVHNLESLRALEPVFERLA